MLDHENLDHLGLENVDAFIADMNALNGAIVDALDAAGEPREVNGGLFYGHKIPDFHLAPISRSADWKRNNFVKEAARATRMFEIGVSAGHSILLAKHANPNLIVIGADIATVTTRDMAQNIAVRTAMNWLSERFGDITYLEGDSRIVAPTFALSYDGPPFDLVHLDGAKKYHFQEALSLGPAMTRDTRIIVDDSHIPMVSNGVRRMLRSRLLRTADGFAHPTDVKYGHFVLSPNF